MHDLVIRGGTVVDGTGAAARTADVAVDGGPDHRSRQPSPAVSAARTVDADGLLVTPGWVDIHTHYDGQATWDEVLAPVSWHGVTTVVMGNCGVGFAPARARPPRLADRPDGGRRGHPRHGARRGHRLGLGDASRVPRRPRAAALDRRRRHPDRPRRGPRLRDGRARAPATSRPTPDDIDGHESTSSRRPSTPGRSASRRRGRSPTAPSTVSRCPAPSPPRTSCSASARALGELGTGVFELAPAGRGRRGRHRAGQGGRLDAAAVGRHRPAGHLRPAPGRRRPRSVAGADGRIACGPPTEGAELWPQVGGAGHRAALRALHTSYCLFDPIPAYQELKARNSHRQRAARTPCATRQSATPS